MKPIFIVEQLRKARLNRKLSQSALAAKVGIGQNQISQLERGIVDPRFSTILDVARALEFELMLVPRHGISVVEGLQRGEGPAIRPLYALDDGETETEVDADVHETPSDDDEHHDIADRPTPERGKTKS